MFRALLPLLEIATVTLIVTQTTKESQNLRITVIPKAKDDKADKELFRAFHVEATLNELEDPEKGFATLLKAERESRRGLEVAITDLKTADAEVAQTKKDEAARKRKEVKTLAKAATDTKVETQEQKEPAMQSLFGDDNEDTNG
jgi:PRTRC genetic system protein E